VARATNQILGEVRSGEVQGDFVGKAAPADGQNSFATSASRKNTAQPWLLPTVTARRNRHAHNVTMACKAMRKFARLIG
jgi:hypothetical protein